MLNPKFKKLFLPLIIIEFAALSILIIFGLNVLFASEAFAENKYKQTNFVANKASYKAQITEPNFVNAWGIAIRPAGAGGHFWITAKDVSYEYVGDVQNSSDENLRKFHTDELKYVKLPVGGDDKFSTGTVFNGSDKNFVITQKLSDDSEITAPAKFLFSSDGGIISAWTERKNADGSKSFPEDAVSVIDESATGSQFFGIAISSDYNTLYAADFGVNPSVKVYSGDFKPSDIKFENPFDDNKNGKVDAGEYAPFNVQALKTPKGENHIFVAYAKTQACPAEEVKSGACKAGEIFAGEEDVSVDGNGKIAEFTEQGKLVKVWKDGGKLSAPWGFAFAPANFGSVSNKLLVTNFGLGTIAALNPETTEFNSYMKDENGKDIIIKQIWGILFGNGESLGDKDALYFAAGPDDEADGLFGSLRVAK